MNENRPETRDGPGRLALWVLLAVTAVVYAPAMDGDFVWDDVMLVQDNAALDDFGQSWSAAWGDFFRQGDAQRARSGYTRPVPVLLNALTIRVFGRTAMPFHIGNLVLHLLAVWLAFLFLQSVGFASVVSLCAAGIFALHPLQTEGVAFISSRPDLCASVAVLASLLLYGRGRRTGSWRLLAASLFCFGLGLLSKEVAVGAALIVLWMERSCFEERRWPMALAFLAVASIYVVIRLSGSEPIPRMYFEAQDTPVAMLNLLGFYVGRVLWPAEPRIIYDHLPVASVSAVTIVACLLVLGAIWALYRTFRRREAWGLGLLWFGVFLAPVLHLLPFPTLAAERYLYLPMLGFGLGVGVLANSAATCAVVPRRWGILGMGLLLVVYGGLAGMRSGDWQSELELWGVELSRTPVGFKVYQNLGTALAEAGRIPEAHVAFRKAWDERPGHSTVFRNLLRIEVMALEPELRKALLSAALVRPPDSDVLRRWADKLAEQGFAELAELLRQRSKVL